MTFPTIFIKGFKHFISNTPIKRVLYSIHTNFTGATPKTMLHYFRKFLLNSIEQFQESIENIHPFDIYIDTFITTLRI